MALLCKFLLAAVSTSAVRDAMIEEFRTTSSHYTAMEAQSTEKAERMFEEAFGTSHNDQCPYGDKDTAFSGTSTSFGCNWRSEGSGNTCPELQTLRLRAAHEFMAKAHEDIVQSAKTHKLCKLFDKSAMVKGYETYEQLDRMQIDGLMDKTVVNVEDKIQLKALAKKLDVPSTTMYYGVHKSEWHRDNFNTAVSELCNQKVDSFMIKATHLAWSAGMKIVRDWDKTCASAEALRKRVKELESFIESDILGQEPHEADAHLTFLEPGVTVEELFKTGGHSMKPLEAKVQTLWGKTVVGFMIGEDPRGCTVGAGSWQVYGDKTGWDLNGIIGTGEHDEYGASVLKVWDEIAALAEKFAKGVQADLMRVDFFIGWNPDGTPVIKLNECESVSGHPYWHERQGLGAAWRDGYLVSGRIKMNAEKWDEVFFKTKADRDALLLD